MANALAEALTSALRTLWHDQTATVVTLRPFGDGHSGQTYLTDIQSASVRGECVVRLSPPGLRIAGPADVGRQARIMRSLHPLGFPVPGVFAEDSSGLVDGRALAVLELVDGMTWAAAAAATSDRHVAEQAISALHRLRKIPVASTSLHAEEPCTLEEELGRWTRLLAGCPERLGVQASSLSRLLLAALPGPLPPALTHGDFHYGNLIFRNGGVAAVLDWEIAAIGDPRIDLGCLAVASLRRRYAPEPNPTGNVDIKVSELVRMYGTPDDDAAWFIAAACLKYAAIIYYNRKLHIVGRRTDPIYDRLVGTMHRLAEDGLAILRGGIAAF